MSFFRTPEIPPLKLKSFKKDIAPVGFFFDIVSTELFKIPIIPVPMRIDKLTNGEPTLIIIPNMTKLDKISSKFGLDVNYSLFYSIGINNFINYAKDKYKEITKRNLDLKKIKQWWNLSKNLISQNLDLRETFTFINSQFIITFSNLIKENDIKYNQKQYIKTLISYCDSIIDYLRLKIENNIFKINKDNIIKEEKLYIEKKNKCYPLSLEITVKDLSINEIYEMKFVPYLIYDDLLNCFAYNKSLLKENEGDQFINFQIYEKYDLINKSTHLDKFEKHNNRSDIEDLRKFSLDKLFQIYQDMKIK